MILFFDLREVEGWERGRISFFLGLVFLNCLHMFSPSDFTIVSHPALNGEDMEFKYSGSSTYSWLLLGIGVTFRDVLGQKSQFWIGI